MVEAVTVVRFSHLGEDEANAGKASIDCLCPVMLGRSDIVVATPEKDLEEPVAGELFKALLGDADFP